MRVHIACAVYDFTCVIAAAGAATASTSRIAPDFVARSGCKSPRPHRVFTAHCVLEDQLALRIIFAKTEIGVKTETGVRVGFRTTAQSIEGPGQSNAYVCSGSVFQRSSRYICSRIGVDTGLDIVAVGIDQEGTVIAPPSHPGIAVVLCTRREASVVKGVHRGTRWCPEGEV